MFVLMVAELSHILSTPPSAPTQRSQFGNRIFCRCGQTGRRFLCSVVPFEAVEEFRSALAFLAEPIGDGRFIVWAAATIDSTGKLHAEDQSWPTDLPNGSVAFVHFLTENESEREELVNNLFGPAMLPELSLAA
jgi:hypothetical protein